MKLVLPKETSCISSVRARFGAEGRRGAHEAERKFCRVEDEVVEEVGDGHLRRRDQEGIFTAD